MKEENHKNLKTILHGWFENDSLLKEKTLAGMIILNKFFLNNLIAKDDKFTMHLMVDEEENIVKLNYEKNYKEKKDD